MHCFCRIVQKSSSSILRLFRKHVVTSGSDVKNLCIYSINAICCSSHERNELVLPMNFNICQFRNDFYKEFIFWKKGFEFFIMKLSKISEILFHFIWFRTRFISNLFNSRRLISLSLRLIFNTSIQFQHIRYIRCSNVSLLASWVLWNTIIDRPNCKFTVSLAQTVHVYVKVWLCGCVCVSQTVVLLKYRT